MADRIAGALAQLAHAVEALGDRLIELTGRVEALEATRAEIERKAEAVSAAQRAWRPLMRVQGHLLLASEAGQTCRVPLAVARVIAAGKALDLDVVHDGDEARLVDARGVVVARLPVGALLALPRVLSSADTAQLLGLRVQSSVDRQSWAGAGLAAQRPHRPATERTGS